MTWKAFKEDNAKLIKRIQAQSGKGKINKRPFGLFQSYIQLQILIYFMIISFYFPDMRQLQQIIQFQPAYLSQVSHDHVNSTIIAVRISLIKFQQRLRLCYYPVSLPPTTGANLLSAFLVINNHKQTISIIKPYCSHPRDGPHDRLIGQKSWLIFGSPK